MQSDEGWAEWERGAYGPKVDPEYADVPDEVRGWNWGAFLLTWIWGLGNRVWQAMYAFIPIYGFFYMFVLGSRGNEFAWKAREWRSVEEFKATQRRWAVAGLAWLVICGGLISFGIVATIRSNARTIGDNPVCLSEFPFEPKQVDCASPHARYQLLHKGTDIEDCRGFPEADVTSTDANTGEVSCLRNIPTDG